MRVNYKALIEQYNGLGIDRAGELLRESLQSKQFSTHDFDFGKVFESIFGWHTFRKVRESGRGEGASVSVVRLMEAAGATSVNQFSNITGQVIYNAIMEKYEDEEFVFTKQIPVKKSNIEGLEKIPGVTKIGDEAQVVGELQEYPLAGPVETYIHMPLKKKRGFRTAVSKEAVFFDRTGDLLSSFNDIGKDMGRNKEKRAINAVIDENGGAVSAAIGGHRYHWRDTSIATYGNNSGDHTWDNLEASNALVDYSDVEKAWLLLKAMKDPDIDEPINVVPKHLVVTPTNFWTAGRILNSTQNRTHVGGYATTGNLVEFDSPNPIPFNLEVLSSQLLADQLATDTDWFMGDVGGALWYMEIWPMDVVTAPATADDEFKRDVVLQTKVSEFGAFGTREPRKMTKSTA